MDTPQALVVAAQCDPRRKDELVASFMPLVGRVARMYRSSPAVDHSELVQAGVVGLLRALERFDAELGTPFWAYASWWVRQSMQQLVAELTWPVVLSDRALRQLARVRAAEREHLRLHHREPSLNTLSDACGIKRGHVVKLLTAQRKARGLDEPLTKDGSGTSTLGDYVVDPMAQDAYDEIPVRSEVEQLPRLLGKLDEREATIVRGRFGLDGGDELTLRELGQRLGVSAECVRQIEQGALAKMRGALAA
jgi:RNA polymerase primary sigma factor